jgi:hypothetical protein
LSQEDFIAFTEEWEDLKYYEISGIEKAKTKGFYTKTPGLYLFSKIFRFIETSIVGDVHISDDNWKMNFKMESEPEEVEVDEDL